MTPDRLRQVEELYYAAREATADQRASLLAKANPELRREVESLLAKPPKGEFTDRNITESVTDLLTQDLTVVEVGPGAILGPYRIESKLGEGGMGEVFRAIDTRLGRAVAIKTNREQFNARFEREARAISSLNHPHICTLYDVGSTYLVMELVEGETLAALLRQGPLPLETAVLYGSQIVSALEEAHGKGIVHRDLKPGNIMIAKNGVKVLDFGLARSEHDETVTGARMIVGTPAYMSPEQHQGKTVDARSDIYAFGCVLYEMLTAERVTAHRTRLRARKLDAIISRCLKEDPDRRWQSAAELERELAAVPKARRQHSAAYSSAQPAKESAQKSKIVLGEFENKTGDTAFDGILRQGLSVQLEQAPSVALISDQQIQQTLRYMNRPPETRLTPEIAHEVCERTGGTAMLEGSITSLGSKYVLWLRARACPSGDILGQEQAQAGRKEDVLKALSRIAVQIRVRLGESLSAIKEHSKPLQEATTHSLEALRAYSAGRSAILARGYAAAIPHLQRAVAIDPQFAMALADLGFFCWNMGMTDLALEYTLKAYALLDRVTDRERFFILFLYDRQVTGNLQKELTTIEAWVQAYPLDWQAWGVLGGWGTRGTGQYERGIQACEAFFRINNDVGIPYESLAVHNIALNRFAEAAEALRTAAERGFEFPNFVINRYYLAFFQGDEAGMKREVDRARGHRETEDWMSHNQALVLARSGQMRNARTMWLHAIALAQQNGDPQKAAIYHAAAAVCEAHVGNRTEAKERAQSALVLGKGRDVKYAAAFATALSGDDTHAEIFAEELAKQFPEDTPVQFEYLPTLRALFALSRNAPHEAIEHLQMAIPYDLAMPGTAFYAKFGGLYTVYVRGLAYLTAGQAQEAASQFRKVLDHRGIVLADPVGALAHLHLARALAASGDLDAARSSYHEFLTLWKNADEDIPVLKEARLEYAKL